MLGRRSRRRCRARPTEGRVQLDAVLHGEAPRRAGAGIDQATAAARRSAVASAARASAGSAFLTASNAAIWLSSIAASDRCAGQVSASR